MTMCIRLCAESLKKGEKPIHSTSEKAASTAQTLGWKIDRHPVGKQFE